MKFIKDIIGEQRTRVRPAAASDDLPLRLETQDRVDDADPQVPITPGAAAAHRLEAVTKLLNTEGTQQQAEQTAPPAPISEERLADDSEFDRILRRTRQEEAALRAATVEGVEVAEDTDRPEPPAPDQTAPTPGPARDTPTAPNPGARAVAHTCTGRRGSQGLSPVYPSPPGADVGAGALTNARANARHGRAVTASARMAPARKRSGR